MNYNQEIPLLVIYKCTNKINGKIYVGKTCKGLKGRIESHKADFLYGLKNNHLTYPLYNAFEKYGFENFDWEVIDVALTEEELNQKEIFWIKELGSLVQFNKGYNINKGGNGGDNFTNNPRKEEIRQKHKSRKRKPMSKESIARRIQTRRVTISKRSAEETHIIGRRISDGLKEYYKTHKNHQFNKPVTEETKEKIKKSLKGRFSGSKNPNYGNKWSEDKKKSLSLKFQTNRDFSGSKNPNCKKCKFYNIESGIIEYYDSLFDFCNKYNLKYDTVQQNCSCHKIIKKIFIYIPDTIEDIEMFVQTIKSTSRWYKTK